MISSGSMLTAKLEPVELGYQHATLCGFEFLLSGGMCIVVGCDQMVKKADFGSERAQ